ncbi:MAG TPA: hypothetical protein VGA42_03005 [Gemmatimonadales bacterium]
MPPRVQQSQLGGVPDAQEDVAAGEIGTALRPIGYLRFASLDGVHLRVEVGGAIQFGVSEFPVGGDNPSAVHPRLLVPVGGPIDLGSPARCGREAATSA